VFAEFSSVDEANIAITAVHGTHFDKSHALFANRFTDIEKFASMDEPYTEPEVEPYVAKVCLLCRRMEVPLTTEIVSRNIYDHGLRILKAGTSS
jgi:hypothetical protein